MGSERASRSIAPRAIPAQARSTATVEKILASATSILVHDGLPALNTNAVAARAGINVATVDHYFPDKVAILAELFRRDQLRRHDYLLTRLEEFPSVEETAAWGADVIQALVAHRRHDPATAVLRRACRTIPELVELEEEEMDRLVSLFAKILRRRYRRLSPNRARHCARAVLESGNTLLDRANTEPEHSSGLVRETTTMISLYFEYLDQNS